MCTESSTTGHLSRNADLDPDVQSTNNLYQDRPSDLDPNALPTSNTLRFLIQAEVPTVVVQKGSEKRSTLLSRQEESREHADPEDQLLTCLLL